MVGRGHPPKRDICDRAIVLASKDPLKPFEQGDNNYYWTGEFPQRSHNKTIYYELDQDDESIEYGWEFGLGVSMKS